MFISKICPGPTRIFSPHMGEISLLEVENVFVFWFFILPTAETLHWSSHKLRDKTRFRAKTCFLGVLKINQNNIQTLSQKRNLWDRFWRASENR